MPDQQVPAARAHGLPWRRFDRLLGELRRSPVRRLLGGTPGRPPIRVDEYRDADAEVIRADLPGLRPDEDVDLTVRSGALRIDARRRVEPGDHERLVRRETRYGSRTRTLPLPPGATGEGMTTTYADGVLEIRVPVSRPPAAAGPAEIAAPARAGRRPPHRSWRIPAPRAASDPGVTAATMTAHPGHPAVPASPAPPVPVPRGVDGPPHRTRVRSADGRLWELVTEPTGVTAAAAAGTAAEALVSQRDETVVVEFWTDGRTWPGDLCADLVDRAFALPAVREHRPVVVCVPRHDGAVLAHARRHVRDAWTRAAGGTCIVEGRIGRWPAVHPGSPG